MGILTLVPSAASEIVTGTSSTTSSPRRSKSSSDSHVNEHEEVAGRPAAQPGLALALDADLAAVLDPCRDLDGVPLGLVLHAAAAAGRARLLDDGAGAVTARARLRHGEAAEIAGDRRRGPDTGGRPWGVVPGLAPLPCRCRRCPACRRARARWRRAASRRTTPSRRPAGRRRVGGLPAAPAARRGRRLRTGCPGCHPGRPCRNAPPWPNMLGSKPW